MELQKTANLEMWPSHTSALQKCMILLHFSPFLCLTLPKARKMAEKIENRPCRQGTRDLAGLALLPVQVGGKPQNMVVDTGDNFSTVTQSTAVRLGLRVLDESVSIRSVSKDSVHTRIGIADELRLGGMQVRNVLSIVVPDEALSFADGAYRIEAILGFPVLLGMKRFAFIKRRSGGKVFLFGKVLKRGDGVKNLVFSGLEPILIVPQDDGSSLHMFIDTGAKATSLYRKALDRHPPLKQRAMASIVRLGGVGGVREEESFTVPTLSIGLSERRIELNGFSVVNTPVSDREGAVGQDVLRNGAVAALDFETMHLCVGLTAADCSATRRIQQK